MNHLKLFLLLLSTGFLGFVPMILNAADSEITTVPDGKLAAAKLLDSLEASIPKKKTADNNLGARPVKGLLEQIDRFNEDPISHLKNSADSLDAKLHGTDIGNEIEDFFSRVGNKVGEFFSNEKIGEKVVEMVDASGRAPAVVAQPEVMPKVAPPQKENLFGNAKPIFAPLPSSEPENKKTGQ